MIVIFCEGKVNYFEAIIKKIAAYFTILTQNGSEWKREYLFSDSSLLVSSGELSSLLDLLAKKSSKSDQIKQIHEGEGTLRINLIKMRGGGLWVEGWKGVPWSATGRSRRHGHAPENSQGEDCFTPLPGLLTKNL